MPSDAKLPPMPESAFRNKYSRIWIIVGACCAVGGLAIGPRLNHSHNPWLSVVAVLCLYAFSVLLCRVVLMSVWRKPAVTPPVLYFSIPVGAAGMAMLFSLRAVGPTALYIEKRNLAGITLAIGLLYAGALIWGIAVGIHRKKLGDFIVDRRRA